MSEAQGDNGLNEVVERFSAARGEVADQGWASAVMLRLIWAEVEPAVVRGVLEDALRLTTQSHESPHLLYGDPRDWTRELLEQWRAEGHLIHGRDEPVGWRSVVVDGLLSGAMVAMALLVALMVRDGSGVDYTIGLLVLPAAIGLMTTTAIAVWGRVLRGYPVGVAAIAAGALVVAGSTAIVGLIAATNDHPGVTASPWWTAVLACTLALLSVLLDRLLPHRVRPTQSEPLDDVAWQGRLTGVLRTRAGLPEQRVQSIVAEAAAHAAEAGGSLEQEFGRVDDFAARFRPDRRTIERREAGLYALLAAVGVSMILLELYEGDLSWSWLALTVLLTIAALHGFWRAKRAPDVASDHG